MFCKNRMSLPSCLLLLLVVLLQEQWQVSSEPAASFLRLVPGEPEPDHNRHFLCYKPWVMECTKAEVEWAALSPPKPNLSLLGATFKEVTSSFFQHGLFHNLSLTHYSGPGPDDLLFLQVWSGKGGRRVNAHAVMSGQRFVVAPCGLDCHLLLTVAHQRP